MKHQEINTVNIGEMNSNAIADYISFFVKNIIKQHSGIECIVMKNFYCKEDNELTTYLYYIKSNNALYDLRHEHARFDLKLPTDLKYQLVLNEVCILDFELVNGVIIFDKTKKHLKLKQDTDYMNKMKNRFKEFKTFVNLEPTIDLQKVKKISF